MIDRANTNTCFDLAQHPAGERFVEKTCISARLAGFIVTVHDPPLGNGSVPVGDSVKLDVGHRPAATHGCPLPSHKSGSEHSQYRTVKWATLSLHTSLIAHGSPDGVQMENK